MFDIGFTELILISILALLILGPERLPIAIKTAALWIGRFKQSWSSIKTELEKELGTDEIRQQLHNEKILKDLGEDANHLKQEFQQSLNRIQHEVESEFESTERSENNIPVHNDLEKHNESQHE